MDYDRYLQGVREKDTFTKQDLRQSFIDAGYTLGTASFNNMLHKMVTENVIRRLQKNTYTLDTSKIFYRHIYTDEAIEIATWLHDQFEYLRFVIFETDQLNAFVNHLIAKNVIYVFVEKECLPYIFDVLYNRYQKHVLMDPSLEVLSLYIEMGSIIVLPLVKQYPADKMVFWHENLEKFFVEVVSDPAIMIAFSPGEYPRMFAHAFVTFRINKASLMRYARRRHAEGRIREIIGNVNDHLVLNGIPPIEL
ncbi:MAG: hypothetical protein LUE27_00670 [Clostridia bacterium]|nr:hypothetical protein [Clostridia bacterium]